MKSLSTILLCLAGAAAGTGLGWLLRGDARAAAGKAGTGFVIAASADSRTEPVPQRGSISTARESAHAAALAQQQGALRWLYLLGAAETATAAEMPALIRAAKGLPGALRMLGARWAELDPQQMFDALRADHTRLRGSEGDLSKEGALVQILFEEWAKKDAAAAIAALNNQDALPGVLGLQHTLMNTLMKSDVPAGLKLMKQWNITNFIPDMKAVGPWVQKNPRAAAEVICENSSGAVSSYLMKKLGASWGASDPAAALAFAGEQRGQGAIQFAGSVMQAWAQRDFKAALAHVNGQTDAITRAQLGVPLVESWAKTDPQAALVWANGNLKGEARANAAGSIVKSMAATDRDAAAEFIAGLEPGGGKDRAVNELIQTWLDDKWFNDGDKTEATAALEWMAALPDAESRRKAMEQAAWRLFYRAPDETIAFLNSPQGATAPPALMQQAARHLAQENPASAMQWTAKLPESQRGPARESVLNEWLQTRPDGAQQWALALPAGAERDSAVRHVTQQLSWLGPALAGRWLESLPAAERADAKRYIQISPDMAPARRAEMEALLK